MHPDLALPGSVVVLRTSHALLLVAVVLQTALAYRWLRGDGVGARPAVRALAVFWVAAFAGGRLHHLAASWSAGTAFGWTALLSPSFHAPGTLVGGLFATALLVPRVGIPAGRFFDAVGAPAGIAFAAARLGCFLNGCCFGIYCSLPWGVVFPRESPIYLLQIQQGLIHLDAPRLAPVHPLQLYFAAAGLAIAAILYWWRPRKRFDGEIGLAFVVLFSSSSAALELWRADQPGRAYLGAWPQLLVVMTLIAITSVAALAVAEWRAPRRGRYRRRDADRRRAASL